MIEKYCVFRQECEPPDLLKLSFETEAEFVAYEKGTQFRRRSSRS